MNILSTKRVELWLYYNNFTITRHVGNRTYANITAVHNVNRNTIYINKESKLGIAYYLSSSIDGRPILIRTEKEVKQYIEVLAK